LTTETLRERKHTMQDMVKRQTRIPPSIGHIEYYGSGWTGWSGFRCEEYGENKKRFGLFI